MELELLLRHPPHQLALLGLSGAPTSYAQLKTWLDDLQKTLREAGLEPGRRLATLFRDGPCACTAFLACAAGATCAPLNPAYRAEELRFYLDDLQADAIMVERDLDTPVRTVAAELGIPCWEAETGDLERAGCFRLQSPTAQLGQAGPADPDVALILHTSGTTSRPKMVPLTRANLLASAAQIATTLQLTPSDRCLDPMPCFHIHGLVAGLLASLYAGASVVPVGFVSTRFPDWLEQFQPSWFTAVPTMHQSILEQMQRQGKTAPAPLRLIRSSSASMPEVLMQRLEEFYGVPLIEAYGMTEAAHQMTSNPLPPARRKPGSVGLAQGIEVAIHNGEVVIRGSSVTAGYLNLSEPGCLPGGWFATGDQGYLDEEGYLFLTGRLKEIINRGGEKISPREVDEVLLAHPQVSQAVTFALPHARLGEEVAAAVVRVAGGQLLEQELRHFAASRLAPFKVPSRVVFVEAIPKGPTGKLQRIGLAEKLGLGPTPETEIAQTTEIDPAHRELWADCLKIAASQLGAESDFFECGGDSILASLLLSRVQELEGRQLSLIDFYGHSRLAEFQPLILQARPAPPSLPGQSPALDLSPAQQRIWFLQRLDGHPSTWLRPAFLRVRAPVQRDRLEKVWTTLQERHPVLRSAYPEMEGRPRRIRVESHRQLDFVDLSELPPEQAEARARQQLEQWAREPLPLFEPRAPWRLGWIRLGPEDHILSWVLHHILCDAWSIEILFQEFCRLYQDLPLPPARLDGAEPGFGEGHLHYWVQNLQGLAELCLPLDDPLAGPSGSQCLIFRLPESVADLVSRRSREWRITPFSLMLGAYACWLARLCQQSRFGVAIPVSGRQQEAQHDCMGLYLNVLVLPINLQPDQSYQNFVEQLQGQVLEALDHQQYCFERLVEALNPPRRLAGSPLYQTMFNLHNQPRRDWGPWPAQELRLPLDTTVLDFQVTVESDFQELRVAYNPSRLRAGTVQAWLESFQYVLEQTLENPQQPWQQLRLVPPPPLRSVPDLGGVGPTLDSAICEIARRQPEQVAVRQVGEPDLSYAELDRRSTALAAFLRGRGQVKPDQVVATLLRPGAQAAVALLGIWKAGAVVAALDPDHPESMRREQVQLCQAQHIVGPDFAGFGASCQDPLPPLPNRCPLSPAFLIFTSGTTGQPKVCVNHHGCAYAYQHGGLRPMDGLKVVAWKASLYHVDSFFELVHGLLSGATLAALTRAEVSDPSLLMKRIGDLGVEQMFLVPSQARSLIYYLPNDLWQLPRLRKLVLTGERASTALAHELRARLPEVEIFNNYGLSESGLTEGSWYQFEPTLQDDWLPIGDVHPPTALYLLDDQLQPVGPGAPGQIYLAGPGLALGYQNAPDASAERWLPDPFCATLGQRMLATGDRGRRNDLGQVQWLGRMDHLAKVRGVRVDLNELERFLAALPGILEAKVVHHNGCLRAFWIAQESVDLPWSEVRRQVLEQFPSAWCPDWGQSVPVWPRTAGDKLDSAALLSLPATAAPTPATDFIEEQVAACWSEVLHCKAVDRQTSFFDVGGNSLTGLELLARLEKALGVRLPVAMLFTHPTIAEQALALAQGQIPRQRSLVLRPGQKGARTLFVIAGLGGDCLSLREMAEVMPGHVRLIALLVQSEPHWQSLEEIAAALVQEAVRLQPSGAYSLAGFSFGGKVAFEMAVQMGEQGRRIAHLMLIDSFPSLAAPRARGLTDRLRWVGQRILFHLLTLPLLPPSRRFGHLKGALLGLLRRVRGYGQRQEGSKSASLQRLLELGQRHAAGVFPGHVLLFQALFQPPHTPPANGWTCHCDSVEVYPVLGFHDADLVKRPWVEAIVAKISSVLEPPERN